MNKDIIKGNWQILKGKAKEQWAKLTDDDLLEAEGDTQKLIGKLQERYGYAKDQAEKEIDSFYNKHRKDFSDAA